MRKRYLASIILLIILTFLLSACQPGSVEPIATDTPDPCLGWDCTFTGTLYADEAIDDNRLSAIPVRLKQISWCSPTKGEQIRVADENGDFSFSVFVHDTDSYVIAIETEGYIPFEIKFGGFDCLYCHCPPLELILSSE